MAHRAAEKNAADAHADQASIHATNVQRLTGALAQIKEMRQTFPKPGEDEGNAPPANSEGGKDVV